MIRTSGVSARLETERWPVTESMTAEPCGSRAMSVGREGAPTEPTGAISGAEARRLSATLRGLADMLADMFPPAGALSPTRHSAPSPMSYATSSSRSPMSRASSVSNSALSGASKWVFQSPTSPLRRCDTLPCTPVASARSACSFTLLKRAPLATRATSPASAERSRKAAMVRIDASGALTSSSNEIHSTCPPRSPRLRRYSSRQLVVCRAQPPNSTRSDSHSRANASNGQPVDAGDTPGLGW